MQTEGSEECQILQKCAEVHEDVQRVGNQVAEVGFKYFCPDYVSKMEWVLWNVTDMESQSDVYMDWQCEDWSYFPMTHCIKDKSSGSNAPDLETLIVLLGFRCQGQTLVPPGSLIVLCAVGLRLVYCMMLQVAQATQVLQKSRARSSEMRRIPGIGFSSCAAPTFSHVQGISYGGYKLGFWNALEQRKCTEMILSTSAKVGETEVQSRRVRRYAECMECTGIEINIGRVK